ncbi:hypothetical protein [uncultured Tateyamaria sp.]|uniref:hypothetical protein n=1 Tax=Tateyamaria sp. 1078 TaxID=3417464 RepID=UPI00260B0479|nr:hypothetical protein [uncultured Tateyamaria sp.]
MTLITPDAEEARTDELLLSVQASLAEMRRHFQALTERADAGEEIKETEVNGHLASLTKAVFSVQKAEAQLGEVRKARTGIVQNGYAIDHDAARAEIRCALGRLRACCGAGAVSG